MTTVEIVELRSPVSIAGPNVSRVLADVAYLSDGREEAVEFARKARRQSLEIPYAWFIYTAELGNPKLRCENAQVVGHDGLDYPSTDEAFEAFRQMRREETRAPGF